MSLAGCLVPSALFPAPNLPQVLPCAPPAWGSQGEAGAAVLVAVQKQLWVQQGRYQTCTDLGP